MKNRLCERGKEKQTVSKSGNVRTYGEIEKAMRRAISVGMPYRLPQFPQKENFAMTAEAKGAATFWKTVCWKF